MLVKMPEHQAFTHRLNKDTPLCPGAPEVPPLWIIRDIDHITYSHKN